MSEPSERLPRGREAAEPIGYPLTAVSFSPGSQVGPYQILSILGKGGMGEVWRARDTKLGREVAIKTLPAEFAHDSDRRGRFEQEARALAALNHSNVGAIYGLEERDGVAFLVLELVEGETLADEIARGPLSIERSLAISAQIAEGLEAAHEAGIIHRDLKPANIKVGRSGGSLAPLSVKILDFGLARTLGPSASGPEMLKSTMMAGTMPGVILGTLAYMSPEQARGEIVDKPTDIFAFGCVLYECLTGQQAFGGATMTDALAATVKSDPEWSRLPANVPDSIRDLLRRCLQKNPRQRLQSIGDARVILQEPMTMSARTEAAAPASRTRGRPVALVAGIAAALLVGVALGRFAFPRATPTASPTSSVRAVLPMPVNLSLNLLPGVPGIVISPDGRTVVFRGVENGVGRLYRRTLDGGDPEPIGGTEGGWDPFFSPDGQWLAFFTSTRLKKVSMGGGAPVEICEVPPVGGGGTWTSDGWIIFSRGPNFPLSRVSPAGGAAQDWSQLDSARGEHAHLWPQALSDGRVLVTMVLGRDFQDVGDARAVIMKPGEKPRDLQEGSSFARIVPGRLLFLRGDTVLSAPLDDNRLEVTGPPARIAEEISIGAVRRVPHFAASQDGTLVFADGPPIVLPTMDVFRLDRTGKTSSLPLEAGNYGHVRLSPDAQRAVLVRMQGMAMRLFLFDLERSVLSPLTPEPGRYFAPAWSPDGKRIAYTRFAEGNPRIYVRSADGSDQQAALTDAPTTAEFVNSWSPDGKTLAYTVNYSVDLSPTQTRGTSDIWLLSLDGSAPPRRWLDSASNELNADFSPDGHFLAYVSDESGRREVYVRPFPGPGGKIQVSREGGNEPAWSSNGREILYRQADRFLSATFTASPNATVSASRELFSGPFVRGGREDDPREYDVSRDGKVVMAARQRQREPAVHQLMIVTNWARSLSKQ
jgi:Tol biopolymer transport system component